MIEFLMAVMAVVQLLGFLGIVAGLALLVHTQDRR